MVRLIGTGGAKNARGLGARIAYLSRTGEVPLRSSDSTSGVELTAEHAGRVAADWGMPETDRGGPDRTSHFVVSFPAGTEPEAAERAGRARAAELFDSDRRSLRLAPGHDETIGLLAAAHPRVVVVLSMPDAIEMPRVEDVDAIIALFFPGQAGGAAVTRILFGDVNPSGRLSVTFPRKQGDIPGIHTYPGENRRHVYGEGIFVGYRSYDLRETAPLFPFGHGLGYSEFAYGDIETPDAEVSADRPVTFHVTVTNTGARPGAEVVQIYVRPIEPGLRRPLRELKAFAKVRLEPGASARVAFTLNPRDFMYFDPGAETWVLSARAFVIEAAHSSRDIRARLTLPCAISAPPFRQLDADTQPKFILENPAATKAIEELLTRNLGITDDEAKRILGMTRGWFLGIHQSVSWYVGRELDVTEMNEVLAAVNKAERGETPRVGPGGESV